MLLHRELEGFNLILASQSPRRKMLLEGLDLKFQILVRENIDESVPKNMGKTEIPKYLAEYKSESYTDLLVDNTLILTADTIVCINDRVIGKPADYAGAVKILRELSGNSHEVITGVCLRSANQKRSFMAVSTVYLRELHQEEIEYYIETYNPYDKAGSYGIQEWIGYSGIEKIEGSFYNVMGLPVQTLYIEMKNFIKKELSFRNKI
jgi:septum formation protein